MPIDVKCSGCSQRMRVPDRVAGKRVKCPKCGSPISVPAEPAADKTDPLSALPSSPPKKWYVRTDDQQEYGPIGKDDLDQWAVEGRLNVDSQILQENAEQWQWAIDLYPELDVDGIYVGGEEELPAEQAPVEQAQAEQAQAEQAQAEQDSQATAEQATAEQATAETPAGKTDNLFSSDGASDAELPATEDNLFASESLSDEGLSSVNDDLFSTDGSDDLEDLDDLSGFDDLSDLDEPE